MAVKFKVGDLVWAKMKGFPAWPGKVIEPKSDIKRPSNKKPHQFVYFFGSENYAWMPEESLLHYASNKEKATPSSRVPKGFKEAVEAADDELKLRPAEEQERELPSIDEELAQIFPTKKKSTPQKDYSREPLSGKKSNLTKKGIVGRKSESSKEMKSPPVRQKREKSLNKVEKKPAESTTKQTKPRNRDNFRKSITKRPYSPTSDSKKTPVAQKRPKVSNSISPQAKTPIYASTNSATSDAPRERGFQDAFDFPDDEEIEVPSTTTSNSVAVSSSTQIEENLLINKGVFTSSKGVVPTPLRIGFLGLGIMGQGMVMNLLRSGHEVIVWNRTNLKCKEFVKAGALRGTSPSDVIQSSDITFTCVSDSLAVRDIVFGNQGVLQGITKGKCYVEMSTIDEETVQDVAEAIMARGGVFLEAPVCGSRVPALEGQLVILTSGDRKLYDDCFSCFEAMGKKSFYLGNEVGTACKMKLVNNMLLGCVMSSLSETMALAEKVGLDQEDLTEILSLGSLSCPTIIHKCQAIMNGKYDPHFPLQHQQKDLRLALGLGDRVEQPLHMASAANEMYKRSRNLGYSEADMSAVYKSCCS
ncbi:cytokine-like nuclear factor N-PAC isoform X2 [Patella vulgata]|uniref:cytokine-like nuclear factor N-PAC isoform X2 n=1 Tax=Patella vulgata TaxID=6465 RepID=UPI00217FFFF2|nr:cytokine-like nuclear factor N-PAC isoform X2 [Patella vulgata]